MLVTADSSLNLAHFDPSLRSGARQHDGCQKAAPVMLVEDQFRSVTLVLGCRAAAADVMNRPEIALRWCVPLERFAPLSVTLVRGCRAAAALEM